MPFVIFLLIALAGTFTVMLNRSGKGGHPCFVPDFRALCQSPLFTYGIYYVEVVRWIFFYHKRVLDFVRLLSHHLRLSYGFYLQSIHVCITSIILHWTTLAFWDKAHLVMVHNTFHLLRNLVYWHLVLGFYVYIHKGCWSVIFFVVMSLSLESEWCPLGE